MISTLYVILVQMKDANISQTRNNLSALLAFVKKGGRVSIRDRKRLIAYIIPPNGDDQDEILPDGLRAPLAIFDSAFLKTALPIKIKENIEEALLKNREEDR